jgi:hypothetical protein
MNCKKRPKWFYFMISSPDRRENPALLRDSSKKADLE